jgi:Uncharacterized protein conserved in bacteria (DUF2263)
LEKEHTYKATPDHLVVAFGPRHRTFFVYGSKSATDAENPDCYKPFFAINIVLTCNSFCLHHETFLAIMPSKSAQRASEFASDVKKVWFPYLYNWMLERSKNKTFGSSVFHNSADLDLSHVQRPYPRPSVAILEGDPVDYALSWQAHERIQCPLVNMANINKAGGDWETIAIGPEENLARRSNLVPQLQVEQRGYATYPIAATGGLYTPNVGKRACIHFSDSRPLIQCSNISRSCR